MSFKTSWAVQSALVLCQWGTTVTAGLAKRQTQALVVPNNLPGAWTYQGCWTDVGRTINQDGYTDDAGMTDESCIAYCSSKGYQYAGTEWFQECYCGSSLAATSAKGDQSQCSTPCKGNSSEACGGSGMLSLFYSSQPVGPQPNPGVNGFLYAGCYAEGQNGRTLGYFMNNLPANNMTVALCTSTCQANNFLLAGVEFASQCFCDNSLQNGGGPAPGGTGCNNVCTGNSTELCGGGNRLNLYNATVGFVPPGQGPSSSLFHHFDDHDKVQFNEYDQHFHNYVAFFIKHRDFLRHFFQQAELFFSIWPFFKRLFVY